MPASRSDFVLTGDQLLRVRALLEAWDARDPWVAAPVLDQQLLDTLAGIVAPRTADRIYSFPRAITPPRHAAHDVP